MANDTFTVERSAVIHAAPTAIYDQIVDFHKWRSWSPWEELDPNLERTYSGAESGVGSVYNWSGNNKAGKGQMKITRTDAPSAVELDLIFEKPWKAHNNLSFTMTSEAEGTHIRWTMVGKKTFMLKVMGIFKSMDSLVGSDFDKGLARLKAVVEQSAS